jgi:hypothetical protein
MAGQDALHESQIGQIVFDIQDLARGKLRLAGSDGYRRATSPERRSGRLSELPPASLRSPDQFVAIAALWCSARPVARPREPGEVPPGLVDRTTVGNWYAIAGRFVRRHTFPQWSIDHLRLDGCQRVGDLHDPDQRHRQVHVDTGQSNQYDIIVYCGWAADQEAEVASSRHLDEWNDRERLGCTALRAEVGVGQYSPSGDGAIRRSREGPIGPSPFNKG